MQARFARSSARQVKNKKASVKNKAHVLKIVILIVNSYNKGKFRADIYSEFSKINSLLSVTAVVCEITMSCLIIIINHWNSNQKPKEKFGSCTRKTFDRFTTKESYTWNITRNTESTAVWSLKPERWGSPLVQEKYQAEKACDKRHPYRIIIIIINTQYEFKN